MTSDYVRNAKLKGKREGKDNFHTNSKNEILACAKKILGEDYHRS